MKHNFLTWLVMTFVIIFVIYVYTSKLPVEQYCGMEHLTNDESDSDDENIENLTLYGDINYSPVCYGRSERNCIEQPDCEWVISDNGSCRPRTSWWGPLFGGSWYNWYYDYWSPWRWSYPLYTSTSYYPTYRRYSHRRYPHKRYGGHGRYGRHGRHHRKHYGRHRRGGSKRSSKRSSSKRSGIDRSSLRMRGIKLQK